MNIFNAIKEGSKILKKNNIKFSALDCEILLAKVLKKERKYLILNLDKKLNRKNLEIFKDLISQRSKNVLLLEENKELSRQLQVTHDDKKRLFPAIALTPRMAVIATLYSGIPALLISYFFLFTG